ncbi:ComEC/Rec2 family competence protein [Nocardioides ochotonae]|uniref:ComEC/Rec2 family competence protein n=1 Tax=Nocardioides ochotonae TaxID=2685869 RepID=UPI003132F7A4
MAGRRVPPAAEHLAQDGRVDGWAALRDLPDLRMPLLGLGAWAGGLAAHLLRPGLLGAVVVIVLCGLAALAHGVRRGRWPPGTVRTAGAVVLVAGAVVVAVLVRQQQVTEGPVGRLAEERAVVSAVGVVASDPRPVAGRFGDVVLVRVTVLEIEGRGRMHRLRAPVLVIGDEQWLDLPLGSGVRFGGRLAPPDQADLAGVLSPTGRPVSVSDPDVWWRAAAAVRASLRASVAHRPADQQVLVPAMVNGDDAGLDPGLADEFRATGLTHLLAVSGTNLTLVVGFLLVLARWSGVRGRWLLVVGALGILGFVLLARTEPSVLRAAVMGTVALVGMGANGLRRGMRALGAAVVALLLVQPSLAVTAGFALSVLATAGILVLAPGWRDAMARWLPRWLAEAVAVPAAAQLACTPVVAGISGEVSLVAVLANLLVAPVVGPATVLGLAGGLVGLLWAPAGALLGTLASWCVAWIILVARRGAALPTAAVDWEAGAASLTLLTLLCGVLALAGPWVLRRPLAGVACCLVAIAAVFVRIPTPGWPGGDWVLAACDVGQGDALVVRTGEHAGAVVDAGPDPGAVDRCLDDLGVREVPLLVLTHFHADHVAGLAGVLDGRSVGAIETASLLDPPAAVADVVAAAAAAGVPVRTAAPGERTVGEARIEVLRPADPAPYDGPGDGTTANDASVVLLVEVAGVSALLTGDLEPPGQAALERQVAGLQVDVLKLPHHGSRHQDPDFLTSLGARVVLVSVGEDNDYGHPAPDALTPFEAAGARVLRTDLGGDLLVLARDDELAVRTRD